MIVARGETQRQVAHAINVGPGVLGRALNGHVTPWPALRRKVAAYLGVTEAEAWNLRDVLG
jgi:transcriptional regulator with XRE-family HTH domain